MDSERRYITQLRISEMWVDVDDIFCVTYNVGGDVGIADAQEMLHTIEIFREKHHFDEHRLHYVLVDNRGVKSMARDARSYFAQANEVSMTGAVAIVVSSRVGEVRGNFFIYVGGPKYPTRLFTSREEAIEWLKMQQERQGR
ncbi:MAG: STAS/SEC14 domain-containing protein [Candidatus Marinimicrobia bacterium]|nr:STAS/SEC14 domain-containing protein [Candidatus Neomarinimicrobiota bacterium]